MTKDGAGINFLGPQTIKLGYVGIHILSCSVPHSPPLLPPSAFCSFVFLPLFSPYFSPFLSSFVFPVSLLSFVHEITLHILP